MKEVSNDAALQLVRKSRETKWSGCEIGKKYFMAEGTDYRPDTDDRDGDNLPAKKGSIMSSLTLHAKSRSKKLGKTVKVSVKTSTYEGVNGLSFRFYDATPATPQA